MPRGTAPGKSGGPGGRGTGGEPSKDPGHQGGSPSRDRDYLRHAQKENTQALADRPLTDRAASAFRSAFGHSRQSVTSRRAIDQALAVPEEHAKFEGAVIADIEGRDREMVEDVGMGLGKAVVGGMGLATKIGSAIAPGVGTLVGGLVDTALMASMDPKAMARQIGEYAWGRHRDVQEASRLPGAAQHFGQARAVSQAEADARALAAAEAGDGGRKTVEGAQPGASQARGVAQAMGRKQRGQQHVVRQRRARTRMFPLRRAAA